jgi:hypothetical protein
MNFDFLNNIHRGWATSLAGIIIGLAAIASVFIKDMSWTEVSPALAIAGGLMFAPAIKGVDAKVLLPFIVLIGLSSCCTFNRCQEKYGNKADTVKISVPYVVHDTISVAVPGDSVSASLDIYKDLLFKKTSDTIKIWNEKHTAELKIWKDKYKSILHVASSFKPDTIFVPYEKKIMVEAKCPPVINFDKKNHQTIWGEYKENYKNITALLFPFLIIILILTWRIKNK